MAKHLIDNGEVWIKTTYDLTGPLGKSSLLATYGNGDWILCCNIATGELKYLKNPEAPVKPSYAFRLAFPDSNFFNLTGVYGNDQSVLYKHRQEGCKLYVMKRAEVFASFVLPRNATWLNDLKPKLIDLYKTYGSV